MDWVRCVRTFLMWLDDEVIGLIAIRGNGNRIVWGTSKYSERMKDSETVCVCEWSPLAIYLSPIHWNQQGHSNPPNHWEHLCSQWTNKRYTHSKWRTMRYTVIRITDRGSDTMICMCLTTIRRISEVLSICISPIRVSIRPIVKRENSSAVKSSKYLWYWISIYIIYIPSNHFTFILISSHFTFSLSQSFHYFSIPNFEGIGLYRIRRDQDFLQPNWDSVEEIVGFHFLGRFRLSLDNFLSNWLWKSNENPEIVILQFYEIIFGSFIEFICFRLIPSKN